jgi:hypothetical protein
MKLPARPRTILVTLVILGIAGGVLLQPAITMVGTLLAPSQPTPSTTPAPRLLADAMWARAMGGRATELQPLNPFTVGRTVSCLIMAERSEPGPERDKRQNDCMTLLPGVEAISYLSSVHMRSEGVWQDPRVPFVAIATMTKMSGGWSRDQLLNTLAERGQFGADVVGAENASRTYFGKSADALTVSEAAFLAAIVGDAQFGTRPLDPWCDPAAAASMRRRVLERMRDNQVVDEAAFASANQAELGLVDPPANHKPCPG